MTNMTVGAIEMLDEGLAVIYRPTLAKNATLRGLQGIVGGVVDCFDVRHPQTGAIATVWFHDEGKILDQPQNARAMALAIVGGWKGHEYGDWIAGNVCLTGFDPDTGETLTLPDEWMELLSRVA